MQTRAPLESEKEVTVTIKGNSQVEEFFGDSNFAKDTLEGRAAFAEGKETILLEELRAEVA